MLHNDKKRFTLLRCLDNNNYARTEILRATFRLANLYEPRDLITMTFLFASNSLHAAPCTSTMSAEPINNTMECVKKAYFIKKIKLKEEEYGKEHAFCAATRNVGSHSHTKLSAGFTEDIVFLCIMWCFEKRCKCNAATGTALSALHAFFYVSSCAWWCVCDCSVSSLQWKRGHCTYLAANKKIMPSFRFVQAQRNAKDERVDSFMVIAAARIFADGGGWLFYVSHCICIVRVCLCRSLCLYVYVSCGLINWLKLNY